MKGINVMLCYDIINPTTISGGYISELFQGYDEKANSF